MSNKFYAIDKSGKIYRRVSKSRVYTHAVIVYYPARPATEQCYASAAYSRAEWAGSLELAQKYARSYAGKSYVESVEIVRASDLAPVTPAAGGSPEHAL